MHSKERQIGLQGFDYVVPTREEIEAIVRHSHQLRSQTIASVLASGTRAVARAASALWRMTAAGSVQPSAGRNRRASGTALNFQEKLP